MDYRIWALLSAIFAGVTAILAKKGVDGVPANTALMVRVAFVLVFSVGLAVATKQATLGNLSKTNWAFLAASAVATWLSWLCYFRALQSGDVARVAPIDKLSFVIAMILGIVILKEKVDAKLIAGGSLIVAGVLVTLRYLFRFRDRNGCLTATGIRHDNRNVVAILLALQGSAVGGIGPKSQILHIEVNNILSRSHNFEIRPYDS